MNLLKRVKNYAAAGLAAATIALSPGVRAEEAQPVQLTAETMVLQDLSSDSRVEVERSGLEAAVEHVTDNDYDDHSTIVGVQSPIISGFEAYGAGRFNYGAQDETGGFTGNLRITIPDTQLRLGVGGGAHFPDQDWIAHANFSYLGDIVQTSVDILHHDQGAYPVDGRGYASILAPGGFYLSLGKAEGPNLFNIIGYIGEDINIRSLNFFNYDSLGSSHTLSFEINPTRDRGTNEFYNRFFAGSDGQWDMLDGTWNPTIGWAPMMSGFGEHVVRLNFAQDLSGLGGGVMYGFNPGNRGHFVELGGAYRHNFEAEDSATATLNLGTDLGAIVVVGSVTADILNRETGAWVYLGRTFDL